MKKIRKLRKLRIGYILAAIILIAFAVLIIKLVLPGADNKYGARLDGIKEHEFTKKEQDKIVKSLTDNPGITTASIRREGKLINVKFTVKTEVAKDDAKTVAGETLKLFSEKVKNFYDIQFMIKKEKEEGIKETVTLEDGTVTEKTRYEFPIMGYSNKKNSGIWWSNN